MLSKAELKVLLSKHNIRPNKMLGQTFLVDKNMQKKILKTCNLAKGDVVFEIGAGLGALTFDIAKSVEEVFAIEKDRMLSKILEGFIYECSNLKVITGEVLKFNIKKIFRDKKIKVIGNLPYYITTPLISYLIENKEFIDSIFVTIQKEVGKRLIANPGSKNYSAISVYTQFYTQPRLLFSIAKGVFYPKPDVDSAFMRLDILKETKVKVKNEKFFFKVVRAVFTKRRKTILNALASADTLQLKKYDVENLLKNININPVARAEELSLQNFADIANSIIYK